MPVAVPCLLALRTSLDQALLVFLPQALRRDGRGGGVSPGRSSCSFQLMRGRSVEGSEPLAQARLAELAANERRLHAHALLDILEDEAVAMRPKHDAKTGAHVVNTVPAPHLPGSKCGTKLLPGPASKAVDSVVSFVVRRPLRNFLTIAHSRLKRRESELSFERTARGEELLVIPGRRVNEVTAGRSDLGGDRRRARALRHK